ncbi:alpha/beta fold hydrolase [Massilia horti]|uniref:Alpha/beta fold hydrolase n=1 Tax=Massilia horti TaxID=2562153 RepID=A0A4Y9T3D3_9BURK|nr:alpha/beta fold hydrolase [Massilia horti]TFW31449.1 alpha/beta fold hydrolase [Massilia horti]TFW31460.1 alpha/beta fold hydrolase [Massilia horti]
MQTTPRPKSRLRKAILAAGILLAAAVVAVPVLRNAEHAPLDAAARRQAPGQFIQLSHGMVHYRAAGPEQGQPVLLVHGFSVPDYVFDHSREALAAAGFRVVSFDLYGRGWSDRPIVTYDRDLLAGELGELMDALHMQQADVVGLSMGGAVAGRFAALHPERVRRLVLIAPVTKATDISVMAWPGVGDWLLRAWFLPGLANRQTEDFMHPERFADWPARFVPQMQYDGFGRALLSSMRNIITASSVPDFEKIGKTGLPVQLIWGERDTTVPYAQHADVQRAIPQAQFVSLPEIGHLSVVEDPAAVHPQLIAFLREQ